MRKLLPVVICIFMLLTAWPALAQEQRGSISGTVTDAGGAGLPGVLVEARSPALIGVQTTYTDARGAYRFPVLAPGRYEITASLSGFRAGKVEDVALGLGLLLRVDISLELAGIEDTVTVTAESPIIDVQGSAAYANINIDLIERMPRGRDFTSVVAAVAPGAQDSTRLGGIGIDGSSGSENRFIIDGLDTTSIQTGESQTDLRTDFIKAVQVKSSGYNAEFRAATGGVISALTKDGSNDFHGTAGTYFDSESLRGDERPTLRLNPSDQNIAEYITTKPDEFTRWEPLFDLGGPLVRDRAWFYAGYTRDIYNSQRTVTFKSNDVTETFHSDTRGNDLVYNATTQITDDVRFKFSGANNWGTGGYSFPGIEPDGTSNSNPATYPDKTRINPFSNRYSGVLDYVASSDLYVNVTSGYLSYGRAEEGETGQALRHIFSGSNFQFPEIPAALQQTSGYVDGISPSKVLFDDFSRFNLNADGTFFGNLGGDHSLKFGFQWERITNPVDSGRQFPEVTMVWDASRTALDGSRQRGQYGYFYVRQIQTIGDIAVTNTGIFIQDSWTVTPKLTLNLGLRTEQEEVPSYNESNPGINFGFAEKPAPRLGFAYDVVGDGRWKLYGSWGMFYDITKLEMSRGLFGADRWIQYYYTLESYNWPQITCGGSVPPTITGADPGNPDCPGNFIEQVDFRHPANAVDDNLIDPDLMPVRVQEFSVGLDHELNQSLVLSVRFTHKQLDRTIEDVGTQVPGVGEVYRIANPGFGTAEYTLGPDFPPQPKAKRQYDGLEFRVRRRFRNNWSVNASYIYSRLYGNYSGLASSDENGRNSPNVNRFFDGLYMSYDTHGNPSYGRLATDSPHVFKTTATYDFSFGTMLGANLLVQSGRPLSEQITQQGVPVFNEGRGSLGRTPTWSRLDLVLQQNINLPNNLVVNLYLNVNNLFDQKIVEDIDTTPYRDSFNVSDQTFFSGNWSPAQTAATTSGFRYDPAYRQANAWMGRRTMLLQARLIF